ncbi:MAG: Biopolymer transport protein ExbD [Verrucomicrobiota bacterium]|jgi:biopolymer transport protein ExbD
MRRFSDKHSMHTLNELNVTPLLDLAFVLLLIFMITTPLMENSTDLVLPTGQREARDVDPNAVTNVSLFKDDRLLLNTEAVTLADLTQRLAALREAKPDMAVLVRPHKELPIQKLMEVMDAVKAASITKVGLAKAPEVP